MTMSESEQLRRSTERDIHLVQEEQKVFDLHLPSELEMEVLEAVKYRVNQRHPESPEYEPSGCVGFPDPAPPPLAATGPLACFRKFFGFRGMTEQHLQDAFRDVMDKKLGLHLFLMGCFWDPPRIHIPLFSFYEFVCEHKVPVKVTWKPRWPGGPNGMYCYCVSLDQCSLSWKDDEPILKLPET